MRRAPTVTVRLFIFFRLLNKVKPQSSIGMQEERESVGGFIDQLRSWLTESVSRTDIDADENRCRAGMCILKGGGKLIAVSRNDAIVVISGRNQGCRIVRALT